VWLFLWLFLFYKWLFWLFFIHKMAIFQYFNLATLVFATITLKDAQLSWTHKSITKKEKKLLLYTDITITKKSL
jgi:hypothetical protein